MRKDREKSVPVFSVVVPVYNADRYLNKALQSILDQDFTDFELILVDDGSTDESFAVLEAFAEKDARIIVLNNEVNRGAAEARNRGIDIARGKYLCFVDADDYIEPDFLRHFYDAFQADDCDFVKCGAYEDYYDANEKQLFAKSCVLPDQAFRETKSIINQVVDMELIPLFGYNWNSCYKMEIIKESKLRFDGTLKVHEDFVFNMDYLPFVRKMRCLSYCGYHYIKREGNSLSCQNENYNLNIRLLKVRSFLSLLKNQQNETQENLDKVYWMFTRFTFSALESGISMDTIRKEKIFADFRKHSFGPMGFKKKMLTGILQSNRAFLIKTAVWLMRIVKQHFRYLFAKIKR